MRRYRETITVIILVLADLLCLGITMGVAVTARYYSGLFPRAGVPPWSSLIGFVCLTPPILLTTMALSGGYNVLQPWKVNEALPTVIKAMLWTVLTTAALSFVLRLGAVRGGSVQTPSRFVALMVWGGMGISLTGVRLLAGRLRLALYHRGVGVRRVVILGDGEETARLAERIGLNAWLGERVMGRVGYLPGPDWLGYPRQFWDVVHSQHMDVVWLVPPTGADLDPWLHSFLPHLSDNHHIWRMLPHHFDRLVSADIDLTEQQRALLHQRVRHNLSLPALRVAMIGSRGAPAHYGGIERYVEEVGGYLAQDGIHVAVYCHAQYVSARGMYRGMELRFVPTIQTKHLETIVHTWLSTLHVLLQKEEIVHYHALGPATLAWLPRLFGRKVVVTVQGLDWQRAKWGRIARMYLRFGEWASAHFPHRTIVVSQKLAAHYVERYRKRTTLIPNGFQPPKKALPNLIRKWGLEKDNFILYVGRLVPEKGCHTLLQAFSDVRTNKKLVLAGDATYEGDYRKRLDDMASGMEDVRLIGFVGDDVLQELYSNAYLVVHPSEMEGLSISLLEAFSYGNCIVVSNVPENLEVIGSAGFSFQVGDAVDLARQMQQLIDAPDRVLSMRDRIRSHVSDLKNWHDVAKETGKLYRSLYAG